MVQFLLVGGYSNDSKAFKNLAVGMAWEGGYVRRLYLHHSS